MNELRARIEALKDEALAEKHTTNEEVHNDSFQIGVGAGIASMYRRVLDALSGCGDPEHPLGAYCTGTTGLHTCYPPAALPAPADEDERHTAECGYSRRRLPCSCGLWERQAAASAPPASPDPGLLREALAAIERRECIAAGWYEIEDRPWDSCLDPNNREEPLTGDPNADRCDPCIAHAALAAAPSEVRRG